MSTLRSERWALLFPPNGESRDVGPAELGIDPLDSSPDGRSLLALATTSAGLSVVVPYTVPITVNGVVRPLFAILQHRDVVRIGEYESVLDALNEASDDACTVCNHDSEDRSHRRCPVCGATYCLECEKRAAGRSCVGQSCRFRFPVDAPGGREP